MGIFSRFSVRKVSRKTKKSSSKVKSDGKVVQGESSLCSVCHKPLSNDSDAFFRSDALEYKCKCGQKVMVNAKSVDRGLGLSVRHSSCGAISLIPPSVWCSGCGQHLVDNWKSLVVLDRTDEATSKISKELRDESKAQRHFSRRINPPKDAQPLRPPLVSCNCDYCGGCHWVTPDNREPHLPRDLDHQAPLRCFKCGRWGVFLDE